MVLFISNRGEIALRIMRSAKKLGFKTAVIFPPIDKELPFVQEADKAEMVESENARDPYLNIDLILSYAKKMGATHLHPGYGFLSERADFVQAVEKSGICFVGPDAHSMEVLGDKIGSRNFLKKISIPLLPSYDGDDQSPERLFAEAEKIGMPLLIKPSAGGGGKGMGLVREMGEFKSSLESSKRIAKASFGDDRVFLERYIDKARHIEVQVLGDGTGAAVAIGERECSIQRRHQKLIEECPCIYLSASIRNKLFDYSSKIAEELKYRSLGTVEWLWDGADEIFFLEVNTRLQVEHPVTELVFNLDLVEEQLKIALGSTLSDFPQVEPKGHAMEVRLCAEDPENDFMPSGGKIYRLDLADEIRNDIGYVAGNTVGSDFDSMMGKIIANAESREAAISKLERALGKTCVFGPKTNRAYLLQVLKNENFRRGNIFTQFLSGFHYRFDIASALALIQNSPTSNYDLDEDLDFYSPWGRIKNQTHGHFLWEDHEGYRYFHAEFADWREKIDKSRAREQMTGESSDDEAQNCIRSPMPGKIIEVLASEGQIVQKGELILIMEAMKMEHKISSPTKKKVKSLKLKAGQQVLPDEVLVELEDV